jgi:hypothetical protein
VNTHYAVVVFEGDPGGEHPDPELRGRGPRLTLIGSGSADFCWAVIGRWTSTHPLRRSEHAEVVARSPEMLTEHPAEPADPSPG